jgi:hypothetical protein
MPDMIVQSREHGTAKTQYFRRPEPKKLVLFHGFFAKGRCIFLANASNLPPIRNADGRSSFPIFLRTSQGGVANDG